MFSKVLIANRGAIAVRIARTLRKMNITSVSVYAEADADSLHVLQADEAYSLGEGGASDTYLNQDKLLEIVRQSGAEAIHPGYGFLSENAGFVERCEAEGIVFIGPTAEQMRSFGLKHTARSIAQSNKVPLLPGTELLFSLDEACQAAADIGYPVMLKSTAGGGGIGMQICRSEAELRKVYDSVKRLSANNFSNDGVFLEKYIEYARHIEVQVFGDGKGKAVALGERDCSAQRRHQKVVEEAPAPNFSDENRARLHKLAARLVAAVNYRNAGTVEFIVDQQSGDFYFLEVNTRLQVEHGVTEAVYGLDLVEWMLQQAAGELQDLEAKAASLQPRGHAIQVRVYAENPHKNFQPAAGMLSEVNFPRAAQGLRIDHWIETGVEVSAFFDPMLAKLISWAPSRDQAAQKLQHALAETRLQGIETNKDYLQQILATATFAQGEIYTRYLDSFRYTPATIDVLSPGTMTTIQDYPGRGGHWDVGVPPSGPFDNYAFRLGNRLLGNAADCAGLEITLNGPSLQFNCGSAFVLAGAAFASTLNGEDIEPYHVYRVQAGDRLQIGKVAEAGARAYLLVAGGFEANEYLGSRSTFTLGQFGGFSGRALRSGDVLHLQSEVNDISPRELPAELLPSLSRDWELRVIYGPQGAPDFFTEADMDSFFASRWEVHYNSSRTGIRLIGPKPQWARKTGGEAGMHPSNIHDNAYAIGTVDFTGDMPVILGPDGPSLGGFVCPATVIAADLWKLGQLKAGDKLKFVPVTQEVAVQLERDQLQALENLQAVSSVAPPPLKWSELSPIVGALNSDDELEQVVYRAAGDKYLLVEYGPMALDIRQRFRVHALMLRLQEKAHPAILQLTPGIRSLQVHYDNLRLPQPELLALLKDAEQSLGDLESLQLPSRIVHLPLSWDDEACRLAIEKYMQSVRKDAPWCPSNIEFIRRINGLESIEDVKRIVFDASYVVMGLGDVYLGAPVATPLDPRHRLVTTKYNPARTWTAENSVGIGGSYLCVYGMEGPGGYQFVGRTLQMWNRHRRTQEFSKPWLLRFFDQIRFYPVSAEELQGIRWQFPRGQYPLRIEESSFCLRDYEQFLRDNKDSIADFTRQRDAAFDAELQRWVESGQINFESQASEAAPEMEDSLPDNCEAVDSQVAGNIWQWKVSAGDKVTEGDLICILESMKMEIEVFAPCTGRVHSLQRQQGQQVAAGQRLLTIEV